MGIVAERLRDAVGVFGQAPEAGEYARHRGGVQRADEPNSGIERRSAIPVEDAAYRAPIDAGSQRQLGLGQTPRRDRPCEPLAEQVSWCCSHATHTVEARLRIGKRALGHPPLARGRGAAGPLGTIGRKLAALACGECVVELPEGAEPREDPVLRVGPEQVLRLVLPPVELIDPFVRG